MLDASPASAADASCPVSAYTRTQHPKKAEEQRHEPARRRTYLTAPNLIPAQSPEGSVAVARAVLHRWCLGRDIGESGDQSGKWGRTGENPGHEHGRSYPSGGSRRARVSGL